MSSQRILKEPVVALSLLAIQQLRIAKLARSNSQVSAHGQEVESDLRGIVSGDALLEDFHDFGGEGVGVAGAVGDGCGLKAVQFVERSIDGCIGNEVESILGLASLLRLIDKGAAAGEAVVHLANKIRVTQRLTPELGWQHHGKLAKVLQLLANIYIVRLVHEHAQESLRRAGVLNRLGGEEDVFGGAMVKGAVAGALGGRIRLVGWIFEEEDDAVEGLEGAKVRGVESQELFELNVLDA